MHLSYQDIPSTSNLFLDYLYEFENVKDFYMKDFRKEESFRAQISELSGNNYPRNLIADQIAKGYEGLKISNETRENIELLRQDKTFVVLGDARPFLFGGSLDIIYRTMTILKLSKYLKAKFEQYDFVPMLWISSPNDNDIKEQRIGLIDLENNLRRIEMTSSFESVFQEVENTLRPTEFKKELIDSLKSVYLKGKDRTGSFFELFYLLFNEMGLLLFSPSSTDVSRMLLPVYTKEILNFRDYTDICVKRSAEIEERYAVQLKLKPLNVFITLDGSRSLLEPLGTKFRLAGKRKKLSIQEITALLKSHPEYFSPGNFLTPVCQNYLLPVISKVSSETEICNFAQMFPMFEFFNLKAPIVYPQASAVLLEKSCLKTLSKFNLETQDFFLGEKHLCEKALSKIDAENYEELFRAASASISSALCSMGSSLGELDQSLIGSSENSRKKMLSELERLHGRAFRAEGKAHEITIRQTRNAMNLIYPYRSLQGKEMSFIYFTNKYGQEVLRKVFKELLINRFELQFIEI